VWGKVATNQIDVLFTNLKISTDGSKIIVHS